MNFPFNLSTGLGSDFAGFTSPPLPPQASPSAAKIDQLIEENNQLLLLSLEALAGELDKPNNDVGPAVPFLQKLQKNLLHLALLAEQQVPVQSHNAPSPVQGWTNGDLLKLKELLFTVGEDPLKLSQMLGKPVEVVNMMLNHLKQSLRFNCFVSLQAFIYHHTYCSRYTNCSGTGQSNLSKCSSL